MDDATRLSVGITAEMLEEVQVVAEARGIAGGELLRMWIEERLELELEAGVRAAPSGRLPKHHEAAVREEVIAAIVRAVDELTDMAIEDLAGRVEPTEVVVEVAEPAS